MTSGQDFSIKPNRPVETEKKGDSSPLTRAEPTDKEKFKKALFKKGPREEPVFKAKKGFGNEDVDDDVEELPLFSPFTPSTLDKKGLKDVKEDLFSLIGEAEGKKNVRASEDFIEPTGKFLDPIEDPIEGIKNGMVDTNLIVAAKSPTSFISESKSLSEVDRSQLWSVALEVIDKIEIAKTTGVRETTVVFHGLDLFEGAQLKITEFDYAKGEFNLSFENLSPAAKAILDLESSRADLQRSLQDHGYMFHILTTNLDFERPIPVDQSQFHQQEGNQGEGRDQKGKEQQKEDEKEE